VEFGIQNGMNIRQQDSMKREMAAKPGNYSTEKLWQQ
jgi:hypothetical protein